MILKWAEVQVLNYVNFQISTCVTDRHFTWQGDTMCKINSEDANLKFFKITESWEKSVNKLGLKVGTDKNTLKEIAT